MSEANAVEAAIGLVRMPTLVGVMREKPVPPDVLVLIRIAAGSEADIAEVLRLFAREVPHAAFIREAAEFYLQHVIMFAGADCYRVLGLRPGAGADAVRDHKRWLVKWLHPDRNPDPLRETLFHRLMTAVAEIESGRPIVQPTEPAGAGHRASGRGRRRRRLAGQIRWVAMPVRSRRAASHPLLRLAAVCAVVAVGIAAFVYGGKLTGTDAVPAPGDSSREAQLQFNRLSEKSF